MKLSIIFPNLLLYMILLGSPSRSYGAEEFATTPQNLSLIEAIKSGNLRKTIHLLKAKKTNPNQVDEEGKSPLMFAVHQKASVAPIMISMLLEKGALLNTIDNTEKTALAHAILANKPQAVRQLLSKGAEVNFPASFIIPEKMKRILTQHSARREKSKTILIDPISGENIFSLDPSQRIVIGKNTYKKETLFDYVLTQIASKNLAQIKDPITQTPIGQEVISNLADHFNIPMTELEDNTNLDSIQTLEDYITKHYVLDEDDSGDEDEEPIEIPRPILSRKRVFEGVRPSSKTPVKTSGFFDRFASEQLLENFIQMITKDTLKVLQYRLQKKNNELLQDLSDDEYKHIQSEIRILEKTIKNRLDTFKRLKPTQPVEPEEPFFRVF